jgi:hypothetical protein
VAAADYFINLGKAGSESELIMALNKYGNVLTAESFLNCGNSKLSEAATAWAKKHGYSVMHINSALGYYNVHWGAVTE